MHKKFTTYTPILFILLLLLTTPRLSAQSCFPPFGIGGMNATYTSADLTWAPASVSAGYEWVVSTSSTPPTGAGTFASMNWASVNNLTPGTLYYLFVRNVCNVPGGGYSSWGVDTFSTLGCPPGCSPPAVTISNISSNTATASWTAMPGATNYQYIVTNTAVPPTGTGTTITGVSTPLAGLNPGSQYYVHVKTNCGGTMSCWSSTGFMTSGSPATCAAPAASATTVTTSSASFSWAAIASATGFEYVVDQNAANPTASTTTNFLAGTQTSVTEGSLTSGTSYYLHIRTNCGGGNNSVWVTVPFTTTATSGCGAPTGLMTYGVTSTGVNFTWNSVMGAMAYEYIITQTSTPPTASGTTTASTSLTANSLLPGTTYWVHVRTQCGGTNQSAWVNTSFTTTTAPAPCAVPTNLTTSSITSTTANASWNAVTGASGYEYLVNTSAAAPTGSGTAVSATIVSLTSLAPSTNYYIHVRTVCSATSFSTWTNISFTTSAAGPLCTAPTNLSSSAVTTNAAAISWNAVATAVGYEYIVNTSAAMPTGSGTLLLSPTTLLSGLTAGTTYYFHVRTKCSPTSFSAWVNNSFTTTAVTPVTCLAPAGLSSAGITSTSATISWTAGANATGYEYAVTKSAAPPVSGTAVSTVSANVSSLTASTTYYFHVRSKCSSTIFSPWASSSFTTSASGSCSAPANLVVNNITGNGASINWTFVSGTMGYEYVVKTTASVPTAGTITMSTTASVTGLTPNTNYYLFVRAKCSATTNSGWSTKMFRTAVSTAVNNVTDQEVNIELYPNPVTDKLHLKIDGGNLAGATVTITDLAGKTTGEYKISSATSSIDLQALTPGVYLVKYKDSNRAKVQRIVKR
jgi:hypothetical protein